MLEAPEAEDESQISLESKHFYLSCVNISQIVKIGDFPLRTSLENLGGWPLTFIDKEWTAPPSLEISVAMIRKRFNTGVLVDFWVGPDDRDSDVNIVQIDQPQLGLPSRDYFLQPESRRNLNAYHKYMTEVKNIGSWACYGTISKKQKKVKGGVLGKIVTLSVPLVNDFFKGNIFLYLLKKRIVGMLHQILHSRFDSNYNPTKFCAPGVNLGFV